ncbi:MAG TPA: acyl transferase [Lacibacter sp.]|nr:acyl transferase [Lacibacter sp.]
MNSNFVNKVFSVDEVNFYQLADELYQFQLQHNPVYEAFYREVSQVADFVDMPVFLPISFFKTHKVVSGVFDPAVVFESSGTSLQQQSRHFVKDTALYEASFTNGFEAFYGPPSDWCFLGLLPSYLERGGSSLVYMVDKLMQLSQHPANGFYLHNHHQLVTTLRQLELQDQKTMLFGVTYALLDFAAQYRLSCKHTVITETGGMKGRREELLREEVHEQLKKCFGVQHIHSEYGMTELMSQAYSQGGGIFHCPPWMKVLVREEDDPFTVKAKGKGALNIIDLANIYSCSFIATDDIGEVFEDGSFKVLGRMDNSDVRGCSLLTL